MGGWTGGWIIGDLLGVLDLVIIRTKPTMGYLQTGETQGCPDAWLRPSPKPSECGARLDSPVEQKA